MFKYIWKRILIAIPVLIGITIIDFALMNLAPGSPLDMLQGPRVSQAAVEMRAEQLGINEPIHIQYLTWMKELFKGNLGHSISKYTPVTQMIGEHIGPTVLLIGVSLIISLGLAIPLGVYSATHQYGKADYGIVAFSFVGTSIPSFFLANILIYIFTIKLKILPSSGMMTLGTSGGFFDIVKHMVMPVMVLVCSLTGTYLRYIRSSMLEILQQDYLRTAKGKGIGRYLVIHRHAMRNALLPIISVIGMQIPMLVGGAVIVEKVFSWPGLGLLTMNAILARDYPVIMGVCLLSAVIVVIGNLLTDIAYAIADPRIRYD
ncbi:MAG: ABC transporter permease [Clostridiales bacterium]|nr:ABC transporter permease [Clostridiales bacterium]